MVVGDVDRGMFGGHGGVSLGIDEPDGGGKIPGRKLSWVDLPGFLACSSPGKLLLRLILIVCPSLKLRSSFAAACSAG